MNERRTPSYCYFSVVAFEDYSINNNEDVGVQHHHPRNFCYLRLSTHHLLLKLKEEDRCYEVSMSSDYHIPIDDAVVKMHRGLIPFILRYN